MACGSPRQRWLTRGVGSVGAASFFSDTGHEITTALLPSFLTSVLHASAAALGLIEGFSDALMGVAKLVAGPLANDPHRRVRMASGGYLGTAALGGLIGATSAVWQAGVLRAGGWVSRGVRSPARDTLLASLSTPASRGRAYGLERAGDNLGAVAGPLLAAWLVPLIGIRDTMYVAFGPGILAASAITVAARAARGQAEGERRSMRFRLAELRQAGLAKPMLPIALFEFGNVATTLLILRSTQLLHTEGRSVASATSLAVLVYAGHNAVASLVSYGGGQWLDRAGPRIVFATGAAVYVLAYAGFAAGPHSWWGLMIAFSLAGSGIGLAETAQSTLVAHMLPDELRGSGFGVLGGVQAAGDLVSTVVAGALYSALSPAAAFAYAAGWMALSVAASGWTATRVTDRSQIG